MFPYLFRIFPYFFGKSFKRTTWKKTHNTENTWQYAIRKICPASHERRHQPPATSLPAPGLQGKRYIIYDRFRRCSRFYVTCFLLPFLRFVRFSVTQYATTHREARTADQYIIVDIIYSIRLTHLSVVSVIIITNQAFASQLKCFT
jgi:hypothetical protein